LNKMPHPSPIFRFKADFPHAGQIVRAGSLME
jgi:hypothetical protein